MTKKVNLRTGVSTFAIPTSYHTDQKLQKSLHLSTQEKLFFKISFPSKNFKNANTQSDTNTLRQLVVKLNADKGYKARTTRTPACNTGFAKAGVQCLFDSEVGNQTFAILMNGSAEKPRLRKARNR
jgi:hypothetical protein